MERTESKGFFEMLWDCDHCETKGLLAKSQRHCPECGGKQNPDKRYYPKEGEEQKILGHAYEGSDRRCPSCDAPMGAKAKACTNCGSPLDGAKLVSTVASATIPLKPKTRKWLPIVLVIVAILFIGFLIWFFFIRTKIATMKVTRHEWTRSIGVDEFANLPSEGWRDAMPSNALNPVCARKERTTKQVEDGETCHEEKIDKADGTFEKVNKCKPKYRDEPVYDDYCQYRVQRWHEIDKRVLSGNGLGPQWPTQDLPSVQANDFIGAKKQGTRTETYVLVFDDKARCEVPESKWRGLADGQQVKVEVRARSGELVCDSF
jgi:hypothetical protein